MSVPPEVFADGAQIHPEKMKAALTMDMLATDIADYLVRKGVSHASG